MPQPTLKLPRRMNDAGGFAAGLFLYIVFMDYLRYGPAGVTGWFKAKFFNIPMGDSGGAGTASGGSGTGSSGQSSAGKGSLLGALGGWL